jgi:hypothetical protein
LEKFYQIGGSFFFGDISGRQKNSLVLFGYEDFDLSATKPSFGAGIRYNFHRYFAVRTTVNYAFLSQSDAKAYSTSRHSRNLSFRTHLFELAVVSEVRVAKCNINSGHSKSSWEYYVFAGIGGFYFNPKAQYKGQYVALRPLTTEGPGLSPNTKPYNTFALALPVGGGLRLGYGLGSSFFIELGYRVTNTDYIDDVSTSYYPQEELLNKRGKASAALSYRGTDPLYPDGRDRGNRFNNDSYFIINLGFTTSLKSLKPTRFYGR